MNDNATKIQAVLNTLQELDIQAQENNLTILLSCYKVLREVRDSLTNQDIKLEVLPDENAHAE